MGQYLIRCGCDVLLWAFCITAVGFLSSAGWIDNPEFALTGGALFLAIRANSKVEVNTVRKISED